MTDKVVDEANFRVEVNRLQPLIMGMEIELPSEEVIAVEFEYIKIEKHCFTCFSLLHEESDCPIRDRNAPHVKDRKLGITQRMALQRIEADKRRHDVRRGYKRPSTEVWYPSERYEDRPSRCHYSEHRDYSHFLIDSLAPQKRNSERGPSHHRTSDSRDSRSSRGNDSRVLSSGVVIRHPNIQVDQTPFPPINRPTALWSSGSLLTHTPSPRNLRERLKYPNERVSSRGTSAPNSRERRSALERVTGTKPDLRTHISPRPGSSLNSDRLQEVNIQYDGLDNQQYVSPMVHIGSSQQHRIPATLRLSDADVNDAGPSNVRANPSTSLTTNPEGKKESPKLQIRQLPRGLLRTLFQELRSRMLR